MLGVRRIPGSDRVADDDGDPERDAEYLKKATAAGSCRGGLFDARGGDGHAIARLRKGCAKVAPRQARQQATWRGNTPCASRASRWAARQRGTCGDAIVVSLAFVSVEARQISHVTTTRVLMLRRGLPVLFIAAAFLPESGGAQRIDSIAPWRTAQRTIAIDERLAADAGLRIGDVVMLAAEPGSATGDTVRIAAIVKRRADPAEVARSEYRIRMHLDHLQQLIAYGDRVDRFAIATAGGASMDSVLRRINSMAFGFRAYPSREIAVETSKTFLVVSRFHRAIGMITIVASATFLLCIMLLKVDERRRDVAAMRLMGISRATVIRTVMLESSFVALLGSLFGVGLGFVTAAFVNAHYQSVYRTPLKFAIITPSTVAYSVLLSLVLGIGAGASGGAPPCPNRSAHAVRPLMRFHLAALSLRRHVSRTLLAILGVAVSAAMLLDMVMLATGMRESFASLLGRNGFTIRVSPRGTLPFDTEATIAQARDATAAMRRIAGVTAIAPVLGTTIHVLGATEPVTAFALGVDPSVQGDYELLEGSDPGPGDALVASDALLRATHAHIGDTLDVAVGFDPQLRTYTGRRRIVVVGPRPLHVPERG